MSQINVVEVQYYPQYTIYTFELKYDTWKAKCTSYFSPLIPACTEKEKGCTLDRFQNTSWTQLNNWVLFITKPAYVWTLGGKQRNHTDRGWSCKLHTEITRLVYGFK